MPILALILWGNPVNQGFSDYAGNLSVKSGWFFFTLKRGKPKTTIKELWWRLVF